jgi:hypothetical protein
MDYRTMAQIKQINIHQTLHGYNEGHKLLATSVELNASEKTILSQLSDSSGTGKEKNFTTYLTGYPLPNSRFYALARTWYADEMPRPGCVWTQTLLIDISTIWMIRDPAVLLAVFKRPQPNNYSLYSDIINLDIDIPSKNLLDEAFFKLTCLYYGNDKKMILLSDSASVFEEIILNIWNYQWPRLKRNFKFCTGSLSLRKLGNELFDLQVVPYNRERGLNRHDQSAVETIDFNATMCNSDWMLDYRATSVEKMLDFMTTYGAELQPLKTRFSSMVRSFAIISRKVELSTATLFDFCDLNFNHPNEGRTLKIALVENSFRRSGKDRYSILTYLLDNADWSYIDWDYAGLILYAWEANSISVSQTQKLLYKVKIQEKGLYQILTSLPPSVWLKNLDLYIELLPELAKHVNILVLDDFWQTSTVVQEAWWDVLKVISDINYSEVIFLMLNNGNQVFAQDTLRLFGEKTFEAIFHWMLQTKAELLPEWQYLVVLNPIGAFKQLSLLPYLSSSILYLFLENVSPTIPDWRKIPVKSFARFFENLEKLNDDDIKTGVNTYFLTTCFTGNVAKPEMVTQLIFQPLHNYLEHDVCEKDSWQRFKMELGRDLYVLLELDFFSKHFKDRQEVPDWDRCEFLRRSLLSSFLKFDWDIALLFNIVESVDTFEKIIQFGADVKPIRKLFKNLRKKLEEQKQTDNKYYKILKKSL